MKGVPHLFAAQFVGPSRRSRTARRALWPALAAICSLTVVGELANAFPTHVDDMSRLLGGGSALLSGRPPGQLLAVYPPSSAVQYLPLALLPVGVAELLTRLASAGILVWMVTTFGRDDGGRIEPWSLVLLISPPAIDAVLIDQFNAALALLALIVAWRLLRSGRPFLAGVVAGIALTRPLAAIPVGVALIGGFARRQTMNLLIGGTVSFGITLAVAFAWDSHLFGDIAATGEHRILVGIVGFMRAEFGIIGVSVWLAVVALLCWIVSHGLRDRPLDAFVVVLALSTIAVHLGGAYVAIFALPAVARLTATISPWWAVAATFTYAALGVAASPLSVGWAVHADIVFALVMAPLAFAAAATSLVYVRSRRPADAFRLASRRASLSGADDGRSALREGTLA